MNITIDRFEGNFAAVELPNRRIVNIPAEILPKEAKEGDVISILINKEETEKAAEIGEKLVGKLWK
ncbi:hypothetical protein AGMMS49975_05140 [Clostridia bacterium]|nr:hypothetical protein AGMMS49975_05140 [Clostridia bacterium]